MATKTLHLRVKDKHSSWLNQQAWQVNWVWNYCVALQKKHGPQRYNGRTKFFSGFDYINLTSGITKEDGTSMMRTSIEPGWQEATCDTI
jgi:hypothetical protein